MPSVADAEGTYRHGRHGFGMVPGRHELRERY